MSSNAAPLAVPKPFDRHLGRRTVMMALLLCAAGVPLLPTNEMKVAGTVWVTGSVLLFGVYVAWRSGEVFGRTALDLPVLAFFAVAVLATVYGVNPRLSALPNSTRGEGLLDYVVYLAAALAASRLGRSEARELLAVLLGAGALIGATGIAQYYGFDPTTWIGSRGLNYGIRSWGTLANPDFLGGYSALVLPIGAAMAAGAAERRQWWGYACAVILVYGALLGSQTRSAWAAVALAAAILLWRLPRTAVVYRRLAALTLACLAVTAVMIATQPRVSLGGRAQSAFSAGDSSMQGKLWIWEHVLPMIRQRPVLGWGFSAVLGHLPGLGTPSYYRVFGHTAVFIDVAHNDLLQVAVNMGLLGVAAYLWIWFTVVCAVALPQAGGGPPPAVPRPRGTSPEAAGLLAGFAAYFVWLQFLWSHIGDANVFWVLAGIALSVGRAAARRPDEAA
ncbi:MAG TPA: O-antigen ligase family protein [bacterium]|nr:O-antigen ligase family protein [bacterium]